MEPIYSEPEFKNEPRQFDFHIYDLLSVRESSYRCLQGGEVDEDNHNQHQHHGSERRGQLVGREEKNSEPGGKQSHHQGRERLWLGDGANGAQKSQHWSHLGLLSDPKVPHWSQIGQVSSDSDYASYDASVPATAIGRGEKDRFVGFCKLLRYIQHSKQSERVKIINRIPNVTVFEDQNLPSCIDEDILVKFHQFKILQWKNVEHEVHRFPLILSERCTSLQH